MKIVAVTSCPTGIAHTYMAAEALEEAAREAGHTMAVETQGAAGATPLTAQQIAEADAVIFAADVPVRDKERFAGLPTVSVTVKKAINDAAGLIAQAAQEVDNARLARLATDAATPAPTQRKAAPAALTAHVSGGAKLRQWLMTGVSYMIPFVAAGGILIALSFIFGGAQIATKVNGGTFHHVTYAGVTDVTKLLSQAGYAGIMFKLGATAFSMLVPILAGFIAYGMADRPGLVAGVVAGLVANAVGAGFLGGLVGGLLAGAVVLAMLQIKMPKALKAMMPIVVIPLISSLIVGFLMLTVVGQPVAAATRSMTSWLNGLNGTNAVVLGALLGLMMAFDMGGPVNKVAYTFGVASLASGNLTVMAAVMAAGMTPPLALALASTVRPRLFNTAEREAGQAAWLLGASFITEGAIPFAAADPVRVIPSLMVGSALTGALSMAFKATSPAPHGGIWIVGLIGKPLLYVVAVAAGMLVSATCVVVAKGLGHRVIDLEDSDEATTRVRREQVAAVN